LTKVHQLIWWNVMSNSYTINCDNNKVEVYVLLWLFCKIPVNKPNDNFCRGVSHKPPFEGLPNECDGGAAIVRYGQSF